MSEDRLQKILARAGVASRRKVEELITEGRVTVNGKVAILGDKAEPSRDAIKVDGKRIQPQTSFHYLVLNKPKGFMSTVIDPEGRPTVMDLIPPQFRKALVPVGRLDFQTEGLLLLTDDGEFAQHVSHPRYGCRKTYAVKAKGEPAEPDLERLRAGVVIDGSRTSPCRIKSRRGPVGGREPEGNTWWTVELFEGRTRQIREMFFRIGHRCRSCRVAIGTFEDDNLPLGACRGSSASASRVAAAQRRARGDAKPRERGVRPLNAAMRARARAGDSQRKKTARLTRRGAGFPAPSCPTGAREGFAPRAPRSARRRPRR